jgi:hypothetical protein
MKKRRDKRSLPIVVRMAGRPVILVGQGPVADTHRRMLERAGAHIVQEGSKAVLAIVIDDVAAVSRLKVRGALVYAVGQPELSDFSLGTTVEEEPEPELEPEPEPEQILPPAAPVPPPAPPPIPAPIPTPVPIAAPPPPLAPALEPEPVPVPEPEPVSLSALLPDSPPAPRRTGPSPRVRISAAVAAVARGVAAMPIRAPASRRERISLDLALAKGGPLEAPEEEVVEEKRET